MPAPGPTERDPLCSLCSEFATDLIDTNFQARFPDRYGDYACADLGLASTRWMRYPGSVYVRNPSFSHKSWEELVESARNCSLCQLLVDDLSSENPPADSQVALTISGFRIVAGFREKFGDYRPDDSFPVPYAKWKKWIPHEMGIVTRRPYDMNAPINSPHDGKTPLWNHGAFDSFAQITTCDRAIPDTSDSTDVFNTARYWLKDCTANHAKCARKSSSLPTRVIDIGLQANDVPRLYVTRGRVAPYVALSHCWGGDIPCKTLKATLQEYQTRLPVEHLPRNFLDAMRVTRELGLRYVWIDALCIIQDSEEDWKAEARKMAPLYSDAFVTVAILDAEKSTRGFLGPRRRPHVFISPDYALCQEKLTALDMLDLSPLDTRGWCMQERFLSPALLHFSQDQIFWECHTGVATEDSGCTQYLRRTRQISSHVNNSKQGFAALRKSHRNIETLDLSSWYTLVEEYNSRDLTYDSDKFAALAGAAERFRSANSGDYIAGLWKNDLPTGLFWSPRIMRPIGFAPMMQDVGSLSKPVDPQAPSWSWASVNGAVEFAFKGGTERNWTEERWVDPEVFQILETNLTRGHNDLAAMKVEGTLKVKAPIAQMFYTASGSGHGIGRVTSDRPAKDADPLAEHGTAVMDFDRDVSRDCWVLVPSLPPKEHVFLLLDKKQDGVFCRVGYGEKWAGQWTEGVLRRFSVTEFVFE